MLSSLEKYHGGCFDLFSGDKLRIRNNAPEKFGVYLFLTEGENQAEHIRYIGKAGSVLSSGNFKAQTLRGRICNKQNGQSREVYLNHQMLAEKLPFIRVRWFVTIDEDHKDLPGYVEANLIQSYFQSHGHLPPWNAVF